MEAIAELHSKLQAVNEKLEVAQKEVEKKKEHAGKLEADKVANNNRLIKLKDELQFLEEEAMRSHEILMDLQKKNAVLDVEREQIEGTLEILPTMFQSLADRFANESTMLAAKIETLYTESIERRLWVPETDAAVRNIASLRESCRKNSFLRLQAERDEEQRLRSRLEEEEQTLQLEQAWLGALDRKNAEIVDELYSRGIPVDADLLAAYPPSSHQSTFHPRDLRASERNAAVPTMNGGRGGGGGRGIMPSGKATGSSNIQQRTHTQHAQGPSPGVPSTVSGSRESAWSSNAPAGYHTATIGADHSRGGDSGSSLYMHTTVITRTVTEQEVLEAAPNHRNSDVHDTPQKGYLQYSQQPSSSNGSSTKTELPWYQKMKRRSSSNSSSSSDRPGAQEDSTNYDYEYTPAGSHVASRPNQAIGSSSSPSPPTNIRLGAAMAAPQQYGGEKNTGGTSTSSSSVPLNTDYTTAGGGGRGGGHTSSVTAASRKTGISEEEEEEESYDEHWYQQMEEDVHDNNKNGNDDVNGNDNDDNKVQTNRHGGFVVIDSDDDGDQDEEADEDNAALYYSSGDDDKDTTTGTRHSSSSSVDHQYRSKNSKKAADQQQVTALSSKLAVGTGHGGVNMTQHHIRASPATATTTRAVQDLPGDGEGEEGDHSRRQQLPPRRGYLESRPVERTTTVTGGTAGAVNAVGGPSAESTFTGSSNNNRWANAVAVHTKTKPEFKSGLELLHATQLK